MLFHPSTIREDPKHESVLDPPGFGLTGFTEQVGSGWTVKPLRASLKGPKDVYHGTGSETWSRLPEYLHEPPCLQIFFGLRGRVEPPLHHPGLQSPRWALSSSWGHTVSNPQAGSRTPFALGAGNRPRPCNPYGGLQISGRPSLRDCVPRL